MPIISFFYLRLLLGAIMKNMLLQVLALFISAGLATTTFARNNPIDEKVVACVYGHKSPLTSGKAKVNIKDGKVHQVSFNNYYPGGRGKLSFTCHLELNRNDEAYVWLEEASGIIITTRENGGALEVILDRKGYLLNFAQLKSLSKYCGPGAELPEELLIPFSGKPCKVKFRRAH